VAAIGMVNLAQSEIGALRGHHMAYLTTGVTSKGTFTVDVDLFDQFLAAVCAQERVHTSPAA